MRRYEWLAKMHRLEAKAATEMATKLRLTFIVLTLNVVPLGGNSYFSSYLRQSKN